MQVFENLLSGSYYHIYNRGINGCNLFYEEENYRFFLKLYHDYIDPITETYAWVLMKNHFHILVRIKDPESLPDKSPHQYFSNLFNSFSKSINKKYSRHGGLMERPFKRKKITDQNYLIDALVYINNNPVHHGFCSKPQDYKWSSYNLYLTEKPPELFKMVIREWFDDTENFIYVHEKKINIEFPDSFETI